MDLSPHNPSSPKSPSKSVIGSAFALVRNYFTPERTSRKPPSPIPPETGPEYLTGLGNSFAAVNLHDSAESNDSFRTSISRNEDSFKSTVSTLEGPESKPNEDGDTTIVLDSTLIGDNVFNSTPRDFIPKLNSSMPVIELADGEIDLLANITVRDELVLDSFTQSPHNNASTFVSFAKNDSSLADSSHDISTKQDAFKEQNEFSNQILNDGLSDLENKDPKKQFLDNAQLNLIATKPNDVTEPSTISPQPSLMFEDADNSMAALDSDADVSIDNRMILSPIVEEDMDASALFSVVTPNRNSVTVAQGKLDLEEKGKDPFIGLPRSSAENLQNIVWEEVDDEISLAIPEGLKSSLNQSLVHDISSAGLNFDQDNLSELHPKTASVTSDKIIRILEVSVKTSSENGNETAPGIADEEVVDNKPNRLSSGVENSELPVGEKLDVSNAEQKIKLGQELERVPEVLPDKFVSTSEINPVLVSMLQSDLQENNAVALPGAEDGTTSEETCAENSEVISKVNASALQPGQGDLVSEIASASMLKDIASGNVNISVRENEAVSSVVNLIESDIQPAVNANSISFEPSSTVSEGAPNELLLEVKAKGVELDGKMDEANLSRSKQTVSVGGHLSETKSELLSETSVPPSALSASVKAEAPGTILSEAKSSEGNLAIELESDIQPAADTLPLSELSASEKENASETITSEAKPTALVETSMSPSELSAAVTINAPATVIPEINSTTELESNIQPVVDTSLPLPELSAPVIDDAPVTIISEINTTTELESGIQSVADTSMPLSELSFSVKENTLGAALSEVVKTSDVDLATELESDIVDISLPLPKLSTPATENAVATIISETNATTELELDIQPVVDTSMPLSELSSSVQEETPKAALSEVKSSEVDLATELESDVQPLVDMSLPLLELPTLVTDAPATIIPNNNSSEINTTEHESDIQPAANTNMSFSLKEDTPETAISVVKPSEIDLATELKSDIQLAVDTPLPLSELSASVKENAPETVPSEAKSTTPVETGTSSSESSASVNKVQCESTISEDSSSEVHLPIELESDKHPAPDTNVILLEPSASVDEPVSEPVFTETLSEVLLRDMRTDQQPEHEASLLSSEQSTLAAELENVCEMDSTRGNPKSDVQPAVTNGPVVLDLNSSVKEDAQERSLKEVLSKVVEGDVVLTSSENVPVVTAEAISSCVELSLAESGVQSIVPLDVPQGNADVPTDLLQTLNDNSCLGHLNETVHTVTPENGGSCLPVNIEAKYQDTSFDIDDLAAALENKLRINSSFNDSVRKEAKSLDTSIEIRDSTLDLSTSSDDNTSFNSQPKETPVLLGQVAKETELVRSPSTYISSSSSTGESSEIFHEEMDVSEENKKVLECESESTVSETALESALVNMSQSEVGIEGEAASTTDKESANESNADERSMLPPLHETMHEIEKSVALVATNSEGIENNVGILESVQMPDLTAVPKVDSEDQVTVERKSVDAKVSETALESELVNKSQSEVGTDGILIEGEAASTTDKESVNESNADERSMLPPLHETMHGIEKTVALVASNYSEEGVENNVGILESAQMPDLTAVPKVDSEDQVTVEQKSVDTKVSETALESELVNKSQSEVGTDGILIKGEVASTTDKESVNESNADERSMLSPLHETMHEIENSVALVAFNSEDEVENNVEILESAQMPDLPAVSKVDSEDQVTVERKSVDTKLETCQVESVAGIFNEEAADPVCIHLETKSSTDISLDKTDSVLTELGSKSVTAVCEPDAVNQISGLVSSQLENKSDSEKPNHETGPASIDVVSLVQTSSETETDALASTTSIVSLAAVIKLTETENNTISEISADVISESTSKCSPTELSDEVAPSNEIIMKECRTNTHDLDETAAIIAPDVLPSLETISTLENSLSETISQIALDKVSTLMEKESDIEISHELAGTTTIISADVSPSLETISTIESPDSPTTAHIAAVIVPSLLEENSAKEIPLELPETTTITSADVSPSLETISTIECPDSPTTAQVAVDIVPLLEKESGTEIPIELAETATVIFANVSPSAITTSDAAVLSNEADAAVAVVVDLVTPRLESELVTEDCELCCTTVPISAEAVSPSFETEANLLNESDTTAAHVCWGVSLPLQTGLKDSDNVFLSSPKPTAEVQVESELYMSTNETILLAAADTESLVSVPTLDGDTTLEAPKEAAQLILPSPEECLAPMMPITLKSESTAPEVIQKILETEDTPQITTSNVPLSSELPDTVEKERHDLPTDVTSSDSASISTEILTSVSEIESASQVTLLEKTIELENDRTQSESTDIAEDTTPTILQSEVSSAGQATSVDSIITPLLKGNVEIARDTTQIVLFSSELPETVEKEAHDLPTIATSAIVSIPTEILAVVSETESASHVPLLEKTIELETNRTQSGPTDNLAKKEAQELPTIAAVSVPSEVLSVVSESESASQVPLLEKTINLEADDKSSGPTDIAKDTTSTILQSEVSSALQATEIEHQISDDSKIIPLLKENVEIARDTTQIVPFSSELSETVGKEAQDLPTVATSAAMSIPTEILAVMSETESASQVPLLEKTIELETDRIQSGPTDISADIILQSDVSSSSLSEAETVHEISISSEVISTADPEKENVEVPTQLEEAVIDPFAADQKKFSAVPSNSSAAFITSEASSEAALGLLPDVTLLDISANLQVFPDEKKIPYNFSETPSRNLLDISLTPYNQSVVITERNLLDMTIPASPYFASKLVDVATPQHLQKQTADLSLLKDDAPALTNDCTKSVEMVLFTEEEKTEPAQESFTKIGLNNSTALQSPMVNELELSNLISPSSLRNTTFNSEDCTPEVSKKACSTPSDDAINKTVTLVSKSELNTTYTPDISPISLTSNLNRTVTLPSHNLNSTYTTPGNNTIVISKNEVVKEGDVNNETVIISPEKDKAVEEETAGVNVMAASKNDNLNSDFKVENKNYRALDATVSVRKSQETSQGINTTVNTSVLDLNKTAIHDETFDDFLRVKSGFLGLNDSDPGFAANKNENVGMLSGENDLLDRSLSPSKQRKRARENSPGSQVIGKSLIKNKAKLSIGAKACLGVLKELHDNIVVTPEDEMGSLFSKQKKPMGENEALCDVPRHSKLLGVSSLERCDLFNNSFKPDDFDVFTSSCNSGTVLPRESLYLKFDPVFQPRSDNTLFIETLPQCATASPFESVPTLNLSEVSPRKSVPSDNLPAKYEDSPVESVPSDNLPAKSDALLEDISRLKKVYAQKLVEESEREERFRQRKEELNRQINEELEKFRCAEERRKVMTERLDSLAKWNSEMYTVIPRFEETIEKVTEETRLTRGDYKTQIDTLVAEKNTFDEHIKSAEAAFMDVASKYEKARINTIEFKTAQTVLEREATELRRAVARLDDHIRIAEADANEDQQHLDWLADEQKDAQSTEMNKLQAQLKKTEVQFNNLQVTLETKTKENQKLAAICDDLIGGKR